MAFRVGINGFGRIGRLSMRVAWELKDFQVIQVNDPAGDATTLAHLLNYDSIHGRWNHDATSDGNNIVVGDSPSGVLPIEISPTRIGQAAMS